jgi:ribosomal protein S18 acetylase RimI-like enzyme
VTMQSERGAVVTIRRSVPKLDLPAMHAIWQHTFAPQWSLALGKLKERLNPSAICYVALFAGRMVGFVIGDYLGKNPGGLLAIAVHPDFQRQSIGSNLLSTLESRLKRIGVDTLNVGYSNTGEHFWPGVPVQENSAWPFFASHGWVRTESSFDLLRNVGVESPVYASQAESRNGPYEFVTAESSMFESVAAFEKQSFPTWTNAFVGKMLDHRYDDVLVARTLQGKIIGTVLLEAADTLTWSDDLGQDCASLSVLGVETKFQKQGIGSGLAQFAFRTARRRGYSKCYINWTGLTQWYGRLGAHPWAEYAMGQKRIA